LRVRVRVDGLMMKSWASQPWLGPGGREEFG